MSNIKLFCSVCFSFGNFASMPNWTNKKTYIHTRTRAQNGVHSVSSVSASADAFTFTMGYLCFSCPLESLFPLISETRTTATTECCTANWNETKRPKRVRVVWRLCWPGAYFMCAFKIINIGIIIISRSWSWLAGAAGKTRARINGLPSILSRTHTHISTYTYTHGYSGFIVWNYLCRYTRKTRHDELFWQAGAAASVRDDAGRDDEGWICTKLSKPSSQWVGGRLIGCFGQSVIGAVGCEKTVYLKRAQSFFLPREPGRCVRCLEDR